MALPKGFKEIPDFEGLYLINKKGDVISLPRKLTWGNVEFKSKKRKLKHSKSKTGYLTVGLTDKDGNSRNYYLHRLLAKTFIPNPDNKTDINHKDGNKFNNSISNIEWCTKAENVRHAFKNGLMKSPPKKVSDIDVLKIRRLKGKQTLIKTADIFGISNVHVWRIQNNKRRTGVLTI